MIKISHQLYCFSLISISHLHETKTDEDFQKNLSCLVCQGQTISDSNSDFALTIK